MTKILVLATATLLPLSIAALSAAAAPDGAQLLDERCKSCHVAARAKMLKKSSAEWDALVTRMMAKGAKLSAPEKKALVDYLAKNYK